MNDHGTSMIGRVCVVTGATSGIGEVTARVLAERGATVIVVGRDAARCARTLDRIRRSSGTRAVESRQADLSSLSEVRELASEVVSRWPRLDVLVNNAGACFRERRESLDGFEMSLALNFLSPFLLTRTLLPALEASESARIVNVTSSAHARGDIDFADLQSRKSYGVGRAYAQSKLAMLLFSYELARRLPGPYPTVNAVHPGLVATRFGRDNGWLRFWVRRLVKRQELSPAEGARTSIYLASSLAVEGRTGGYYVDCRSVRSSEVSYDADLARRLWREGCRLTGPHETT